MSDPSHPEQPEQPAQPAQPSHAAPPAPPESPAPETPAPDAAAVPEATPPTETPRDDAATPPAAPQYVQPYPGAPPVPVTDTPAASSGPSLPPYAAAAGYPGAPAGGQAPAQGNAPASGQYAPPQGQYTPASGHYAPPQGPNAPAQGQYAPAQGQYPPPGGTVPPGAVPPSGPGRPADTRPKVLAIIALGLAVLGAILAFIPIVGLIGAPFLIAAIVIAIIALVSKKQGGTGFSIAALIVSVLAGLAAIITMVVSLFVLTLGGLDAMDDPLPDEYTSEPLPEEEDATFGAEFDLELVETAFGDRGDGSWWYAIVIDNPNDDAVFDYGDFTVVALDADGQELALNDEYLTILPGTVAVVGSFEDLGGAQIAELEVDLPDADEAYVVDATDLGSFSVDDVSASADDFGTEVAGTITSDFSEDADYVLVSVLLRDAAGTIVAATIDVVDSIPAGGTGTFQAQFYDTQLTDGMTIEVYPAL